MFCLSIMQRSLIISNRKKKSPRPAYIYRNIWQAVVTENYLTVNAINSACLTRIISCDHFPTICLGIFLQCIRKTVLVVSVVYAVRCLPSTNRLNIFQSTPNPGRARYRAVWSIPCNARLLPHNNNVAENSYGRLVLFAWWRAMPNKCVYEQQTTCCCHCEYIHLARFNNSSVV